MTLTDQLRDWLYDKGFHLEAEYSPYDYEGKVCTKYEYRRGKETLTILKPENEDEANS